MLDNNRLVGQIPAELGTVSNLRAVSLTNNSLSCTGVVPGAVDIDGDDVQTCDREQLLPCFLHLTHTTVPRPDSSSMECPLVLWKPHEIAVQNCSGSGVNRLGDQATNLANVSITDQRWDVDPSYYQYSGCKCLGGYQAIWSHNKTVLKCVLDTHNVLAPWFIPTAVITTFIGICLLGAVALLVWLKVTVQLRLKWQRERDLLKYRQKGVPNGGPATIVVTDVESYSGACGLYPAATPAVTCTHVHCAQAALACGSCCMVCQLIA
eukprot:GHUV01038930.1.p1 GENE.GHUV01038930.1~~GHUV01038930.1.p1  ORF type:complete len:265 (+),score=38.87 GHUV01038930.1:1390-2184(+)